MEMVAAVGLDHGESADLALARSQDDQGLKPSGSDNAVGIADASPSTTNTGDSISS
jgi:hypothetical protein